MLSSIEPSSNNLHTKKQQLIRARSHTQNQKQTGKNYTHMKTRSTKPLEPHKTSTPWETHEQAKKH